MSENEIPTEGNRSGHGNVICLGEGKVIAAGGPCITATVGCRSSTCAAVLNSDFVGRISGSVEIEWKSYPGMLPNPNFVQQSRGHNKCRPGCEDVHMP